MAAGGVLKVAFEGSLSAAADIGTVLHQILYGPTIALGDGSGANQISQIFADTRTLAASATEDLDLNGTLLNAFGVAVTFTKIRALLIVADAANVNDVVVGGAAANQFFACFGAATHTVKVKPGGMFLVAAPDVNGYAVTAATADLLKVLNGGAGTGVTYTIMVLGS